MEQVNENLRLENEDLRLENQVLSNLLHGTPIHVSHVSSSTTEIAKNTTTAILTNDNNTTNIVGVLHQQQDVTMTVGINHCINTMSLFDFVNFMFY